MVFCGAWTTTGCWVDTITFLFSSINLLATCCGTFILDSGSFHFLIGWSGFIIGSTLVGGGRIDYLGLGGGSIFLGGWVTVDAAVPPRKVMDRKSKSRLFSFVSGTNSKFKSVGFVCWPVPTPPKLLNSSIPLTSLFLSKTPEKGSFSSCILCCLALMKLLTNWVDQWITSTRSLKVQLSMSMSPLTSIQ